MTSLGNNKWQITLTPRSYFGVAAGVKIYRLGMVFRSAGPCGGFSGQSTACKEGKTPSNSDIFVEIFDNQFQVSLAQPSQFPLFKDTGENLTIVANASATASMSITINGAVVNSATGVMTINYTHTITEGPGNYEVVVTGTTGTETKTAAFRFIVRATTIAATRPPGVVDGINYLTDPTKVVLSLWAPGKSTVYIFGDFNNWQVDPDFMMKRDGEHFWLELTGLESGKEYAYQYLVSETVYVADPYADKILDPDDQFIPATSYPSLKAFPAAAKKEQWYFNRVAVMQTAQAAYTWSDASYKRPAKEKLVIYELLLRDYFGEGQRNYQNLIDTLGYLKKLGVTAVELMPIMEFNGNESWGYNPTFMFAPDKYYGTRNKLKELVDKLHQNGIAVILDIAMNHQDMPNPYVLMDFDFATSKPTPANKWFNQTATHPFSVFFDMNHESAYTKKYLDTVAYHWIHQYHVDGFRFDLSKGFTQKQNPSNVSAWSAYDASRIALLKRMADVIWSHSSDAYIILEHFADNTEERELAAYRATEGKGMLLWGKLTDAYNQLTMGYAENTDITSIAHVNRGWDHPHLVGYMESHDEERLMYKNLQFGNSTSSYSVRDLPTSLTRMKAAQLLFYTVPGPKMLWQFGELGYDESINRCPDGTISDNCRISPKPVKWTYREQPYRNELYNFTADLIRLRSKSAVFHKGSVTMSTGSSLLKQIALKNVPFTTSPKTADEMNIQAVANFDVVSVSTNVTFSHSGAWYNYYSGTAQQIDNSLSVTLSPGQFTLFTDFPVKPELVTGVHHMEGPSAWLYPNPADDKVFIELPAGLQDGLIEIYDMTGRLWMTLTSDQQMADISSLSTGLYAAICRCGPANYHYKLIKK